MERDGVVEEELRSAFENTRDSIVGEVRIQTARDIGEQEGHVICFGGDGGQSREGIGHTYSDTWDGVIVRGKYGSDRSNVLLDMSRNALLVELALVSIASVETMSVDDANFENTLHLFTMSKKFWHLLLCRCCSSVRNDGPSRSESKSDLLFPNLQVWTSTRSLLNGESQPKRGAGGSCSSRPVGDLLVAARGDVCRPQLHE